jgi:hypothetical protein
VGPRTGSSIALVLSISLDSRTHGSVSQPHASLRPHRQPLLASVFIVYPVGPNRQPRDEQPRRKWWARAGAYGVRCPPRSVTPSLYGVAGSRVAYISTSATLAVESQLSRDSRGVCGSAERDDSGRRLRSYLRHPRLVVEHRRRSEWACAPSSEGF